MSCSECIECTGERAPSLKETWIMIRIQPTDKHTNRRVNDHGHTQKQTYSQTDIHTNRHTQKQTYTHPIHTLLDILNFRSMPGNTLTHSDHNTTSLTVLSADWLTGPTWAGFLPPDWRRKVTWLGTVCWLEETPHVFFRVSVMFSRQCPKAGDWVACSGLIGASDKSPLGNSGHNPQT